MMRGLKADDEITPCRAHLPSLVDENVFDIVIEEVLEPLQKKFVQQLREDRTSETRLQSAQRQVTNQERSADVHCEHAKSRIGHCLSETKLETLRGPQGHGKGGANPRTKPILRDGDEIRGGPFVQTGKSL